MDKLPEEIQKQIWFESIQYIGDEQRMYRQAATAWAHWKVKYDELKKEADQLRRWKMEATELLTKINSYAHKHLEIKLGQCAVDLVIGMAKERDELKERSDKMEPALQQFVSYHETGLLPDRFTYEKGVEALKKEVGDEP